MPGENLSRYLVRGCRAAAREIGKSPITVRRLVKSGKLKAIPTGGRGCSYEFWRSDLEKLKGAPAS